MAIGPDAESFPVDIETQLRIQLDMKLGPVAVGNFFKGAPTDPIKRGKAILRQLQALKHIEAPVDTMPLPETQDSYEEPKIASVTDITPQPLEEPRSIELMEIVSTAQEEFVDLDAPFEAPIKSHPAEPEVNEAPVEAAEEIEKTKWSMADSFKSVFDGVARRHAAANDLDVTHEDKDAVIATIMAIRGKEAGNSKPPFVKDILGLLYDGMSRTEIAKHFNVPSYTVTNRINHLHRSVEATVEAAKSQGTDVAKFMMNEVLKSRGEEYDPHLMLFRSGESVSLPSHGETIEPALDDVADKSDEVYEEIIPAEEQSPTIESTQAQQEVITQVQQVPVINPERTREILAMTDEQLRSALDKHMRAEGLGHAVNSLSMLLNPQGFFANEIDYVYGRNALSRMLESELGQLIFESTTDRYKKALRSIAGKDVEPSQRQTMASFLKAMPPELKQRAEHELLIQLNKMIPVESSFKAVEDEPEVSGEHSVTDVETVQDFVENTEIIEDIDLFEKAYFHESVSADELEGGINSIFERAVSAGVFTQNQANWLRRRVKGADEPETRLPGEKSAVFAFGKLCDGHSLYKQTNYGDDSNFATGRMLNAMLGQFRSNMPLEEVKKVVENAQSSRMSNNAYKVITPEEVPVAYAGAVCDVLEYAIQKLEKK